MTDNTTDDDAQDDRPPVPQSNADRAEMEFGQTNESIEEVHERIKRKGRIPEKTPEERRRARYYRR